MNYSVKDQGDYVTITLTVPRREAMRTLARIAGDEPHYDSYGGSVGASASLRRSPPVPKTHVDILKNPLAYSVSSTVRYGGQNVKVGEASYQAALATSRRTPGGVNIANRLSEASRSQDPKVQQTAYIAGLAIKAAQAVQQVAADPAAVRRVKYLAGKGDRKSIAVATALFNNQLAQIKLGSMQLAIGVCQGDQESCARAANIFRLALNGNSQACVVARVLRDTIMAIEPHLPPPPPPQLPAYQEPADQYYDETGQTNPYSDSIYAELGQNVESAINPYDTGDATGCGLYG